VLELTAGLWWHKHEPRTCIVAAFQWSRLDIIPSCACGISFHLKCSVSNSEAGQDSLGVSKIMEKGETQSHYLQSALARVDVDEQALSAIYRAT
jgi:hypothetical protein